MKKGVLYAFTTVSLALVIVLTAAAPSDAQFRSHPGGHGTRIFIGGGSPFFFSPFSNGFGFGWPYYAQPYSYNYSWYYSTQYVPSISYVQPLLLPYLVNPPPEPGKPRLDNAAKIEVALPEAANLWFDGKKTELTGAVRNFETPPLMPGQVFFYDVTATWTDQSGAPITRKRTVEIYAGQQAKVNLMLED